MADLSFGHVQNKNTSPCSYQLRTAFIFLVLLGKDKTKGDDIWMCL